VAVTRVHLIEPGGALEEQGVAAFGPLHLRGEDWTQLAQFESVDGLLFGDAGALYLVIPEVDLYAARFDRVMGIMPCT